MDVKTNNLHILPVSGSGPALSSVITRSKLELLSIWNMWVWTEIFEGLAFPDLELVFPDFEDFVRKTMC